MKFKEIREAYKGNLKDFEYEVNLAVDNPRLVKAVKKNGKQYEVRLSTSARKEHFREIENVTGAKMVKRMKMGPFMIGIYEAADLRPVGKSKNYGKYAAHDALMKYKKKNKLSPLKKKLLMKHYSDVVKGKAGAISKIMDLLKDDVNEELNEAMTAAQKRKRLAMIKKAVDKINARNLKRAKADAMKALDGLGLGGLLDDDLEEKGKGLWHNIHQRRKSGKRMRKKGEKGAPTAAAMARAKGESVNEDTFKLVDMSRKTAKIADKLAQKVGLDTDLEGGVLGVQLTVHGTKKKIEKWLQSLPTESVNEGMDSYDGLRIAKYLAHKDGESWRRMKYGIMQGYLDDAEKIMKTDKAKARDILSRPTPRSL